MTMSRNAKKYSITCQLEDRITGFSNQICSLLESPDRDMAEIDKLVELRREAISDYEIHVALLDAIFDDIKRSRK